MAEEKTVKLTVVTEVKKTPLGLAVKTATVEFPPGTKVTATGFPTTVKL